ncbi:MAG: T9SS type A sorting domain-containing protein, partial [Bacteroidota bacterium]
VVEVRFEDDGQKRLVAKPYPNPADTVLNIQMEAGFSGAAVLQILNEQGQQVGTYNLLLQNGINHSEINVERLAAGRYLGEVLVSANNGVVERLTAFRFGIYR